MFYLFQKDEETKRREDLEHRRNRLRNLLEERLSNKQWTRNDLHFLNMFKDFCITHCFAPRSYEFQITD